MKNSNDNRTRDLSANELRHRLPPFIYKSIKDIDQATFYFRARCLTYHASSYVNVVIPTDIDR
jgi:hypothetical protein